MTDDLIQTLDLLVSVLEQQRIEYAIMGGLAVRAYSIPRATVDIDFTLAITRERLSGLFAALEEQDYEVPEPYRTGWVDEVKGLKLVKLKRYVAGRIVDVDLFLAESPFQESMLRRKVEADVEGRKYWIASAEDLVLLKLAAGRQRDMLDVADVFFTQGNLDLNYMQPWATALGVNKELDRAVAEYKSTKESDHD